MRTCVVVGNPQRESRTRAAAEILVEQLCGHAPDEVIELTDLGASLLGRGDSDVATAVLSVKSADLVVFASPTYKATYTGLLKLFLEQFASGTGLQKVVAVPLMLGGSDLHSLAPELTLKPVLAELGATTALPGLYLVDSTYADSGEIATYAARWQQVVDSLCGSRS